MPVTNIMSGGSVMWNMSPWGVIFGHTASPLVTWNPPGKTCPPFINTTICTITMMIACFRFSYKKLAHSLSLERKEYISQISIFFSALLITYETRSGAEAKMLICEIVKDKASSKEAPAPASKVEAAIRQLLRQLVEGRRIQDAASTSYSSSSESCKVFNQPPCCGYQDCI